jgi:DNA repair exonuclease SbcCD ATPase subunit
MKYINFNKVRIQNFLSVGNVPVEVDFRRGLHIITGINKDKEDRRNGVGKSTVADSIYFAVFGETLRELKKEHIVNNINKKNCEVVLDATIKHFDKTEQISIRRTLEPSKCYITINGEDKTRDSISNTNAFIMRKFNCTPEIFQNCVIMTINNTTPFMAKKKQEKRRFIEDIFNLGIFSEMLNLLKSDVGERKKDFDIESTRYDEAVKTLERYELQQQKANQERIEKRDKYKTRQSNNAKEIEIINNKLASFTAKNSYDLKEKIIKLNDALKKLDTTLQAIRHQKSEKQTLISQLEKQIKNVISGKDKCPSCLRIIKDNDKSHIEDEKKKLNNNISEHESFIDDQSSKESQIIVKQTEVRHKIKTLESEIHNIALEEKDIKSLNDRLIQLNEWQGMLEQDIHELETATNSSDDIINEQKEKCEELKLILERFKSELSNLDIVKFVVSEEGVKSYIVTKILQLFNNKLAYYLGKMDANCKCEFNEYFEEKIVDNKGKECSYFNFSGAERKSVDLACLFAFMDIRRLQGDVCFNFSIYDELFDSSLDERGVELVINILKERIEKFNESIMVISHRKESIKAATGDVIFLEKTNGITRRVDYKEYSI